MDSTLFVKLSSVIFSLVSERKFAKTCLNPFLLDSQTSSSSIAECEPTSGLRVADSPGGGGAVTGGAVVNVTPLAALQGVHLGAPVGHPSQAGTGHQQSAQQSAPRPHPAGLCLLCNFKFFLNDS